jgi:hypothetical protein
MEEAKMTKIKQVCVGGNRTETTQSVRAYHEMVEEYDEKIFI